MIDTFCLCFPSSTCPFVCAAGFGLHFPSNLPIHHDTCFQSSNQPAQHKGPAQPPSFHQIVQPPSRWQMLWSLQCFLNFVFVTSKPRSPRALGILHAISAMSNPVLCSTQLCTTLYYTHPGFTLLPSVVLKWLHILVSINCLPDSGLLSCVCIISSAAAQHNNYGKKKRLFKA